MADLLGGAAVGALMGETLKYALENPQKVMKSYNKVLDRPREEIERLESHILAGQEENFGQYLGTQIRGLSGAPDEPECMGMDEPLNKLKIEVSEFQSDEDATNRLGPLLRQVGRNPILLVLDDVWPGSEWLVEKFKFNKPDYKILVTSRVAIPRFGNPCHSYMPDEDLVHEIVRGCKGSPLAVKVIAGSLCQQPFEVWQDMKDHLQSQSILESSSIDLLRLLQQTKGSLFLPSLIWWAELHNLDEDGRNAMTIVHDLTTRNLINVIITRNVATVTDMYYNNHFVMLHDLLRDLAIHQNKGEPFEQRKRLIIDLKGDNRPEWWVGQNQQGIIGHIFLFITRMLVKQEQLRVAARILSISTDETFTSDWCDMQPDEAEVLVLNIRSSQYSLPDFTYKMSKLKVLIVTNYGFHRSELNKFELLGFLSNLKRIRLEKVSVPCLCILENLRKLSLHMCNTKQAFEGGSIQISKAMPNLVEMSIDYCNDLVKLPVDLCNITPLKKLSITNCHKLRALPQEIAKVENLEVLRLCSCSDLVEMPDSIGGLNKLHCLDISDCVNLLKLPEDIGDLQNLKKLYMKGCSSLSDLPYSVTNLKHKIHVICDEERATLWEHLPANFKIEMPKVDINLNWLHGVRS
ncbi:P-loop containing nucleoside triphosphate hydrolase [Sesbania bispinosa]|nr:P-loop containing nucleoside triphosphate hydrolase [Sesbania bispinosa]